MQIIIISYEKFINKWWGTVEIIEGMWKGRQRKLSLGEGLFPINKLEWTANRDEGGTINFFIEWIKYAIW